MKVGLFFGSFNPIHTGHLIIANSVINETGISNIWFIVSPQNPLKAKTALLDANARLLMVSLAVHDDSRFKVSDVEFSMPVPSYTITTLGHLEAQFPENEYYLVLGSDSFLDLPKWREYERLIRKNIIIYKRPGYLPGNQSHLPNVTVLDSPLLEVSSTEIRTLIKSGKSIRYLVPEPVVSEIEKNKYYR